MRARDARPQRDVWEELRIIIRERDSDAMADFERGLAWLVVDARLESAVRAFIDWRKGKGVVALASLDEAAVARPLSAHELLVRGLMHLEAGNASEARSDLTRAAASNLRDPRLECGLAALAMNEGQHAGARMRLDQALAIDPQYWEAHYLLGLSLDATGRRKDAIRCFERVTTLATPENETLFLHIARVLIEAERHDLAQRILEPVVKSHPEWTRLGLARVDALAQAGHVAAAIAALAPIAETTNDPDLIRLLASWLALAGDLIATGTPRVAQAVNGA